MTPAEMVTLYARHGGLDNARSILAVAEIVILERAGHETTSGEDAIGMLAAARVVREFRESLHPVLVDDGRMTPGILAEMAGGAR